MKYPTAHEWRELVLGDVVDFHDHKRVPLSRIQRQGRQGVFPYYGASGIIDYINDYIYDGRYLLVAEDGENLRSRKTPIAFFASGKFWVNNHAHVVTAKPEKANDYFLMRILESSNLSPYITGAAQPKLSQENLKRIKLCLPPLPVQFKIASILSAYDDLIENNTRRIKLLEEMAQAIYREWFVNFRFPGHEKVKMVKSELGKIPEGWEISRLGDACASLTDGDWIETKDQGGQDYRLLQVSNIGIGQFVETGNYRYITKETFDRLRCQEVKPGDILISRMPKPTGRAWLVTQQPWKMITAVDVAIAKADSERLDPYFFLQLLNSPTQIAEVEKRTTGTTRPRISRSSLASLRILLPPLRLQKEFGVFAESNYQHVDYLIKKNAILRRTRDFLLPKLISGELDVSDLDIKTEAVEA